MAEGKEPIAIIGSGCRFPGGVDTPSGLWDLLRDPVDLRCQIPEDRFCANGFYHQNGQYHGHSNTVHAYLLSGDSVNRRFDAHFFGINTVEANALDPQVRLLLETVYEALESAGLTINDLQGSDTAMYAGQMVGDYERMMLRDEDTIGIYHGSGTARSLMSNRVSYFFDWCGPSMTIDTACSSSLVAVHQAVQQLRSGESRVAVAAGANLILDPQSFISFSKLGMLSPEGRSRMWDASANGYGRGEGVAAILLKTLRNAEADGDRIECIIRETGVNQDGKTSGITVPDPKAQVALIKGCYARAGLNLANIADRPQYFEAHGTGTLTGDPAEAEAISSAFFPVSDPKAGRLFVGSIKTIIGHTEGAAGLAGLLKASLALQKKTIPPNLLFNHLNPRIEPFYSSLCVPTSATQWPTTGTRRASVNSFGFGGTNAHAILESYDLTKAPLYASEPTEAPNFNPFVFSATSKSSLSSYIDNFCTYLKNNQTSVDLRDLAYTLYARRTRFKISTSVGASTVYQLRTKLQDRLQDWKDNIDQPISLQSHPRSPGSKPRIIGIFTGQGAQWPQQGSEIISNSATAHRILATLERRLSQLPPEDRPCWSLIEEIQKGAPSSCVYEAALSQPLCTAIQILQVDILRSAGVDFCAVVGHSSGEIAAAYAAGRISAEDAICIAYYRGKYASLAQGTNGQSGAMLAVSTSLEDIRELCESPELKGRVCVAAINSVTSVTVSGDKDAIEEVQDIIYDEKKISRILKVDKAYHSHHMSACSAKYLEALGALKIRVFPGNETAWLSSVYESNMSGVQPSLEKDYWNDNLKSPVLFAQAIRMACNYKGPFDLAVEVGPHPALKGPALETLSNTPNTKLDIPYTGLFHRGRSSIETVAEAIGFMWSHLGNSLINLRSYDRFLSGAATTNQLMKELPPYSWDHSRKYWHESRYARAQRNRPDSVNPLLGHRTPDSTGQDIRWRQILRPREISWLKGHRLQGQIVFPAAGYVTVAVESARSLCQGLEISVFDISDLEIFKALTFEDEDSSKEALFSLTGVVRHDDHWIDASFNYNASDERRGGSLDLLASGRIRVLLGKPTPDSLPARSPRQSPVYPVSSESFYASMRDLEYQYSPPFTGLTQLERRLGISTGFISNVQEDDFLVHPAVLDAAFQSIFLAQSFPGDGGLWALHVPKIIRHVRVNPLFYSSEFPRPTLLSFDAVQPGNVPPFSGDVDIYADGLNHSIIQVEGLTSVPLATITSSNDRELFSITAWGVASPAAELVMCNDIPTSEQRELACALERAAVFYLRHLDQAISSSHPCRTEGPISNIFPFASHVLTLAQQFKLEGWKAEWEFDTHEDISMACQRFSSSIDVEFLQSIGNSMIEIARGEKSAIEIGMEHNLLTRYYTQALDMSVFTEYLASIVGQIVHRYPQLDILEVGAGTGAATRGVLQNIGRAFASYTYTDISSGFFGHARGIFSDLGNKMAFRVLDINTDPVSQGFSEGSYDLVIASMVLHTTRSMAKALQNIRRLIKPGGYIVVLEGLPDHAVRLGAIFGTFPGWWSGSNDGRLLTPFVDLAEWDQLLRTAGFSTYDTITKSSDLLVFPLVAFVAQAIDTRVSFLRDPIPLYQQLFGSENIIKSLVLVGGDTPRTSRLIAGLQSLAQPFSEDINSILSFPKILNSQISPDTTIVSLTDLDQPFFKHPNNSGWEALKAALLEARTLLWVTHARCSENPHSNMILGILRSSLREIPTLDFQSLDFENLEDIQARLILENTLRLVAIKKWQREGTADNMLITAEPEMKLSKDHRMVIPRLLVHKSMNDRYNSSRRSVMSQVRPDSHAINVSSSASGHRLYLQPSSVTPARKNYIRVSHSLLSAVKVCQSSSMFLMIGIDCESGEQQVSLSETNGSLIHPWQHLSIPVNIPLGFEADVLSNVAYRLIASVVLEGLTEDDHILVYEPPAAFAAVLAGEAGPANIRVTFTTSDSVPSQYNWKTVQYSTPRRLISGLSLSDVSVFVDFSKQSEDNLVSSRIISHLPPHCRHENAQILFNTDSWRPRSSHLQYIPRRLQDAVEGAKSSLAPNKLLGTPTISAGGLSGSNKGLAPYTIVDWVEEPHVSAMVRPVDSDKLFYDSKTYWLAGLSGGLGLSLCEWMVRHGARYFVISSRRPKIDNSWLRKMSAAGAIIRVFSCDVTNRLDLIRTYAEICRSLPAIGGIAQGAMVLQDAPIRDMKLDQLLCVTHPKVDGSSNLDNLLHDHPLDFFVFFSSASAVVGNPGQSNYSAANLFMCSLAEQRRKRGQAASVINIGPILGVGYIAQQGIDLTTQMHAGSHIFISEHDFHQLFAEAILSGAPGSSSPIEITTGISMVSCSHELQPAWGSNPMMSHFIQYDSGLDLDTAVTKSDIPIKVQLSQARTKSDVSNIIHDALIPKLCVIYQLNVENLAKETLNNSYLNAMGTDSLIAIDIRSWFLSVFQVNIPVLRILSGISIGELIEMAANAIPSSLLPNVQGDSSNPSVLENHIYEYEGVQDPLERDTFSEIHCDPDTNDETQPSSTSSISGFVQPAQDRELSNPDLKLTTKLSFSQSMFWFVLTFLEDKTSLNHTGSFRLSGRIDYDEFENALCAVGSQHASLRTCFFEKDHQPVQAILETSLLRGEYRQISNDDDVAHVVKELERHTFDLEHGDIMRVVLLSLTPTSHFLVLGTHSLVMDGWSFRVFLKDLECHYTHTSSTMTVTQSFDYSIQQHQAFEQGKFDSELSFWKSELSVLPPPLPVLRVGNVVSHPPLTAYENERVDIRFQPGLKSKVQELCRSCMVTPFHFYLTVFRVLLLRYASTEDVSIGIADANRINDSTIGSIGSFVNLIPLCFHTKATASFVEVVKETRDKAYAALANSRIPFQVLLNELDIPRSATSTPIFQSFVDYRLGQQEKIQWANCNLEMLTFQVAKLSYDVSLDIIDDPEGDCLVMFIVRKELYNRQDAERLARSFEIMVEIFSKDPATELCRAKMFDGAEIDKAIAFGRGPRNNSSWPETIIHKFHEVAACRAAESAVELNGGLVFTYAELLSQVNIIANALKDAMVQSGQRVAVLQEPTPNWIASILAIMQSGATYVPLDQGNPWSRLAAIMEDCQPSIMLVDDETQQHAVKIATEGLRVINVTTLERGSLATLSINATTSSTATVLYTSGSSGVPKGIILRHEALKNWFEYTAQVYDLNSERVLQQSSSGFDMSLIQIFTALCFGGCLYLVPRRYRGDAMAISDLIYSQRITYTFCCTSELVTWFRYGDPTHLGCSSWRRAIAGGEPGIGALLQDFAALRNPSLRLFHAYGPTETSFTAMTMELFYDNSKQTASTGSIAVGYTLPNYTVNVLDEYLNPLPPGIQGEIYVCAPGVSANYLNRANLNMEKFIPNRLANDEDKARGLGIWHRTGDIGRWDETGALFVEGRISGDTQIKLRGLRIDLREVEHVLTETAQGRLNEAVVSSRRFSAVDPEFLIAHVVFDQTIPENERLQITNTLAAQLKLPRYMCPAIIVPVAGLPRTNTGKLDRRAVSAFPLPGSISIREVGLSETEARLRNIWEEIIPGSIAKASRIVPGTDFFHVGGTSLLLLELRRRIHAEFGADLHLIDLFDMSTLCTMASVIDNKGSQTLLPVIGIDWEKETSLTSVFTWPAPLKSIPYNILKTVVLTGSTGYLGRAILDALIRDSTVKRIHCIAVRNAQMRHVLDHKKVCVYEGDLLLSRLGLSEEDSQRVFEEADLIIHNGADVSYGKKWSSLRPCNLQATKEIAEMSNQRPIPFHYISSGAACSFAASAGCSDIPSSSVAHYPPPATGVLGYAASKWASEVFLEKLNARYRDWPICIHRLSNLARAGEPHLDLVHNLRYFSRLLRAVPVMHRGTTGVIDSVSLDKVVHGIMSALHYRGGEKLRFVHHTGTRCLPLDDMGTWINDSNGTEKDTIHYHELEQMSFATWAKRAGEQGMHPTLVAFIQTFGKRGNIVFPRLATKGAVDGM